MATATHSTGRAGGAIQAPATASAPVTPFRGSVRAPCLSRRSATRQRDTTSSRGRTCASQPACESSRPRTRSPRNSSTASPKSPGAGGAGWEPLRRALARAPSPRHDARRSRCRRGSGASCGQPGGTAARPKRHCPPTRRPGSSPASASSSITGASTRSSPAASSTVSTGDGSEGRKACAPTTRSSPVSSLVMTSRFDVPVSAATDSSRSAARRGSRTKSGCDSDMAPRYQAISLVSSRCPMSAGHSGVPAATPRRSGSGRGRIRCQANAPSSRSSPRTTKETTRAIGVSAARS